MIEYSIVIPAYNESDKISASLTQVVDFMRMFEPNFEVVVVDDGSQDRTVEIVEEYAENNQEIRLIKNKHMGKAVAWITGVREAAGNYIYLADADFSANISELKKVSVWMKDQGYDIVICSREGKGAVRVNEPWFRHFIGRVFNLLVQIIALPGIKDSQCGFKLFKSDVAKRIFQKLVVYGGSTQEIKKPFFGALDVEVLYLARKMGYKIKEVPVTWTYVRTSRLNFFSNSIKMAADLLKIRLNDFKGAYK